MTHIRARMPRKGSHTFGQAIEDVGFKEAARLLSHKIVNRCIRCNTDYTKTSSCTCGANASLRDNRGVR